MAFSDPAGAQLGERVGQQQIRTLRSFVLSFDSWWTQHQPGIEPDALVSTRSDPLVSGQ